MTIARRLALNAAIAIAMIASMAVAILISVAVQRDFMRRSEAADELMQGAFELNVVSDYYLRHPEERPKTDWINKQRSLLTLLLDPSLEGGQVVTARMRRNLDTMGVLFYETIATLESPAVSGAVTEEQLAAKRAQLADLMLIRSREVSLDATRLNSIIHLEIQRVNHMIGWFFSLTLVFLTIVVIAVSTSLHRTIVGRVRRLRAGVEVIGAGNLEHKTGLPPDDEIGELSQAFDAMADQLKQTMVSRDTYRISESRFHTLFDQAPLGIYLLDSNLRFREINPIAMRVFHGATDVIGRDFESVAREQWPADSANELIARFRHTLETGVPCSSDEWQGTRQDVGLTECYQWQLRRIPLPEGGYGVVCHFQDITSQVHARQTAAESESRYHSLFHSMDEGFCVLQMILDESGNPIDYRFVESNPAFERHSGLVQPQGRTIRELLPEIEHQWLEIYAEVARTGQARRFQNSSDALGRWFDVYAFRVGLPCEHKVAVLFTDITVRREIETALRESETRYRTLFNSMEQAFVVKEMVFDQSGRIDFRFIEVNPAFEKQSGLKDVIGKTMLEVLPDIESRWIEHYAKVARSGQPTRFQEYVRQLDRWFDVFAWRVEHPSASRIAILFSDVTQQVRSVDALQQARDQLERRVAERTLELQQRADQLARLASQLTMTEQRERRRLAQVLHDHLQQLLVGAKFGLDLVSRHVDPGQLKEIENVEALIDESIKASRSLTVELSPPIVHQSGLAAGLEWLATWTQQKHGLNVDVHVDPEAVVHREDVRLLVFEAVRELLFNVVKHAQVNDASIELSVYDDEYICATVSDSGCGFEPSATPVANEDKGGFGLFSIRERLALLGGRLEVLSFPGGGSRFSVIAPRGAGTLRDKGRVSQAHHAAAVSDASSRKPAHNRADGTIHVVLVDDHDVVRQGLAALIAAESDMIVIGEASNGAEAVQLVTALHPDVVLVDISMPVMDGIEATRQIRQRVPDVRVICLSMFEESERAAAMLAAGAAAFLTKSGESETLLKTIRSVYTGPDGRPPSAREPFPAAESHRG